MVDASHWPADVRSVDGLAGKVRQLRALARDASAIWITVDAAVAVDLLPALVQAAPDAVIVRLESGPISLLREALSALRKPLDAKLVDWRIGAIAAVVEPLDAVLLWSWGAELIAVDRLLNDHLQAPPAPPAAAENSFFGVQVRTPSPMPQIRIGPIVTDWLERTASLVGHLGCASPFDLYLSKMVVAG